MYQRILQDQLQKNFFSGNIIMLLGARQIGKTTLATELLKSYDISEIASFNGDDAEDNEALSKNSLRNLNLHVAESKIILIDEAQKIPNI
ncbi:hypothetical protein FACS189428_4890 [Clostridia bacterium]|nr:hypothetical protein FACS189428_4890 [Clostridia bacterium]